MHTTDSSPWRHSHDFAGEFATAERNTRRVLALTAVMMAVEIFGGLRFRSMALLADGWHMGTHVAAFAISAFAYRLARRQSANARFTFGTGKIGVLGAFTSAVILGGIALYMAGESAWRLFHPAPIAFAEAIPIASVGLVVNVLSALLLKHDAHDHSHHDRHHHHDLNLKSAYVHVIADAVTSILAITALTLGKFFGWNWLDPVMGVIGSAAIARWASTLFRETGPILLDSEPEDCDLSREIRKALETGDTVICDLHIWQVGVRQFAAIVSLVTHDPKPPESYKQLLAEHEELVHVTVEVHYCEPEKRLAA